MSARRRVVVCAACQEPMYDLEARTAGERAGECIACFAPADESDRLRPEWLRALDDEEPVTLAAIPPYPVDALPDAAQALVRAAGDGGLPEALVGGAALAAMAAALGSASEVRVLSDERA